MATPLRAFMLTKLGDSEWSVEVFHDLERLRASWRGDDGAVGVVHVGFERPPARHFDEMVEPYRDRVLLTAPARFALPSQFAASSNPVAEVSGLPVYLALTGWGYEIDDPPRIAGDPREIITLHGWLFEFVKSNPSAEIQLAEQRIVDDDTYAAHESNLPFDLRVALGQFRYRALIGNNGHDPGRVASASPPWLLDREVDTLGLTVRLSNVFATLGIRCVRDLSEYTLYDLLRTANFGRKSVSDLLGALDRGLEMGPADPAVFAEQAELTALLPSVRRSLLAIGDRERDMIARRMGFDRRAETLQEIGESYGITRERVRQIEAKAIRQIKRQEFWDDLLTSKLRVLLHDREFPLPLLGVEAVDEWFQGVADAPSAMRYILANICDHAAHLVTIDEIIYLGFLNQDRWESTLSEARKLLLAGVDNSWTEHHCRLLVESLLPPEMSEFRSILWDKSSHLCHFSGEDGSRILLSYGRGVEQIVEVLLDESERPLYYTELAELAASRAGRPVDVRRAHSAAASVGFLYGRGTYGSMKHLPLSQDQIESVIGDAEDFVEEGHPERQWHSGEILSHLIERETPGADLLDKYTLDIILARSGSLASLRRMIWARSPEGESEFNRIDVRQAVIAVVQQAGRPLRANDIKQRLIALRGIGPNFQLSCYGQLVRVAPGLWGLNDRDLPIKKADQPRLLDTIASALESRGSGIHSSELWSGLPLIPGLTAEALFSLASQDPRLHVSGGQYLYLRSWGEPRRLTVTEAVQAILDASPVAVSFSDLVDEVGRLVGRPFERPSVSACLQAIDAEMDSAGHWTKRTELRDDQDDATPLDRYESA